MRQEYLAMLEAGFAVTEANLYLDTHPEDEEALKFFLAMKKQYMNARREYSDKFGPVSLEDVNEENGWAWAKAPWPWEGGNC